MKLKITKKGFDWLARWQGWCGYTPKMGIVPDRLLADRASYVEPLVYGFVSTDPPAGFTHEEWMNPSEIPHKYASYIRPRLIKALKKLKPQMLMETGQC
jgi:hypothetical protein